MFESRASRALLSARRMDLSFREGTHYLRMPYALHERTGLVSLPLTLEEYDAFDPEMARVPSRGDDVVDDVGRILEVMAESCHRILFVAHPVRERDGPERGVSHGRCVKQER